MTKETYQDPKTPMIQKFFFHYTLMGGSLSLFEDFKKLFIMWINIPIVQLHYPLEGMKIRTINALDKHFKII
jgi:hypothetical protein